MTTLSDTFRVWPNEPLPGSDVLRRTVPLLGRSGMPELAPDAQWDLLDPRPLPDGFFTKGLLNFDPETENIAELADFLTRWGIPQQLGLFAVLIVSDSFPDPAAMALVSSRLPIHSLQNAVRAWQMVTEALDLAAMQETWWSPLPRSAPISREHAIEALLKTLNEGLGWSSPRAWRSGMEDPAGPVYLETAVCTQLFNAIVEGNRAFRCRNETCPHGGWGYKRGWSTESVRYCSPECADMQTSRERRRHVGDANRLARQGLTAEQVAARMGAEVGQVERWIAAAAKRRKGGK